MVMPPRFSVRKPVLSRQMGKTAYQRGYGAGLPAQTAQSQGSEGSGGAGPAEQGEGEKTTWMNWPAKSTMR